MPGRQLSPNVSLEVEERTLGCKCGMRVRNVERIYAAGNLCVENVRAFSSQRASALSEARAIATA